MENCMDFKGHTRQKFIFLLFKEEVFLHYVTNNINNNIIINNNSTKINKYAPFLKFKV